MNKLITLLILVIPALSFSQDKPPLEFVEHGFTAERKTKKDSLCDIRGHVVSDIMAITAMYCPPYILEYENRTVKVYPNCNTSTYRCVRCNRSISERSEPDTVTIWTRP